MIRWLVFVLVVFSFTTDAYSQTVDINASDDSAQIAFRTLLGEEIFGYSEFNAMFIYTSDDKLGSLGFDVLGDLEVVPDLELGVGLKLYGADVDDNDVLSLGLGAVFRYSPIPLGGLVFLGTVYYSPHILSFLDADRLLESDIRLGYQIIPRATVYIGYRYIWTDIEDKKKMTVDKGIHAGLTLTF
ncbi:MAG: YfaZ family outer membrane protein [Thermodesulfobacteriota bacterium]|nr:YfaZ family outer membrane protein [Thermodesulfobacteriota bacterium]